MYIGIQPPDRVDPDHHITLTFNGHGEKKQDYLKAVVALAHTAQWWHANGNGRIQVSMGSLGVFPPMVTYAQVNSPKLHRFREHLTQELRNQGVYFSEDHGLYTPHLTLSYGVKDIENPYEGMRFSVPTLSVMSSAFGRTDIQV